MKTLTMGSDLENISASFKLQWRRQHALGRVRETDCTQSDNQTTGLARRGGKRSIADEMRRMHTFLREGGDL